MGCMKKSCKKNNCGCKKVINCQNQNDTICPNNKNCNNSINSADCSECKKLQCLSHKKADDANDKLAKANKAAQQAQQAEKKADDLKRQAIEECQKANVLWNDYKRLTKEGECLMDEAQRLMKQSAQCYKDCYKNDVGCNLKDYGVSPINDFDDDDDCGFNYIYDDEFTCNCDCNCGCNNGCNCGCHGGC